MVPYRSEGTANASAELEALQKILDRTFSKVPEARYASALALLADLEPLLNRRAASFIQGETATLTGFALQEEMITLQLLGGFKVWVGKAQVGDAAFSRRKAKSLLNSTIPLKGARVKESLQAALQGQQAPGDNDRQ